jgi:hypothetical protein
MVRVNGGLGQILFTSQRLGGWGRLPQLAIKTINKHDVSLPSSKMAHTIVKETQKAKNQCRIIVTRGPVSRNIVQLQKCTCTTFYGAACTVNLRCCIASHYFGSLCYTKVAQLTQGWVKSAPCMAQWGFYSKVLVRTGQHWKSENR